MFRICEQCATNKEALFNLLKEDVVTHGYPPNIHVHITSGSYVKSKCAYILVSANGHQETGIQRNM